MTERFRRLYDERGALPAEVTAERDQIERARRRAEALQICAAFAVAFGLAAIFPFVMDYLRGQSFPGTPFLSLVFGVVACSSAIGWMVVPMLNTQLPTRRRTFGSWAAFAPEALRRAAPKPWRRRELVVGS